MKKGLALPADLGYCVDMMTNTNNTNNLPTLALEAATALGRAHGRLTAAQNYGSLKAIERAISAVDSATPAWVRALELAGDDTAAEMASVAQAAHDAAYTAAARAYRGNR